jgi:choline-glycine betaine transporter
MNPLVPTPFDGTMMVVAVIAFVLMVVALFSLILAAPKLSGWRLVAWALLVLLVPFVGPAAWLISRQRERTARLEQQ